MDTIQVVLKSLKWLYSIGYISLITSSPGAVAKYCDECVCLSIRQGISGVTRAIFTKFSVHVAYVTAPSTTSKRGQFVVTGLSQVVSLHCVLNSSDISTSIESGRTPVLRKNEPHLSLTLQLLTAPCIVIDQSNTNVSTCGYN